jgi:hypothetical protein
MLKCETNTPEVEKEIISLASTSTEIGKQHKNLSTAFEHGQWWVICLDCGSQWSVTDCHKDCIDYVGFESLGEPTESCLNNADLEITDLISEADPTRPNHVELSDRELNQVLAALRHWQNGIRQQMAFEYSYSEYLEDGLTFMSEHEIDELCERFNLGPIPEDDSDKSSNGRKA